MNPLIREHFGYVGKGALLQASGLGLCAASAALCIPWIAGRGAAELADGSAALHITLLGIVALLAARLFFDVLATYICGKEALAVAARLRKRWHGEILGMPPGSQADERRQEWVSLLSYDIPRVVELLVDVPVGLAKSIFTLMGAFGLMVVIHPVLAVVVLCAAPLAYAVARLVQRELRLRASQYWDVEIGVMTQAEEAFRSRWAVQAFRQEPRFQQQFEAGAKQAAQAGTRHLRLLASAGPAIQFVTFAGMVALAYGATSQVVAPLDPAGFLTFILYGLLLSAPLRELADGWYVWHEVDATLTRFDAVRAGRGTVTSGSEQLADGRGDVRFERLEFGWRDDKLFDQASLHVAGGEHVAIVGANGTGKTTLIALLLGFAHPKSGTIAVDGVCLEQLTLDSRRSQFAVVPQHDAVFGGTIRDNVAFANPQASDSEIQSALEFAQGWEFVSRLPHGLDTRVGADGLELSGGQRQRVAIARAVLADAPILVLDEAASHFDAKSKERLQDAVARLHDKTVLWITHDEDVFARMTRVIRIERGQFVELPRRTALPEASNA